MYNICESAFSFVCILKDFSGNGYAAKSPFTIHGNFEHISLWQDKTEMPQNQWFSNFHVYCNNLESQIKHSLLGFNSWVSDSIFLGEVPVFAFLISAQVMCCCWSVLSKNHWLKHWSLLKTGALFIWWYFKKLNMCWKNYIFFYN